MSINFSRIDLTIFYNELKRIHQNYCSIPTNYQTNSDEYLLEETLLKHPEIQYAIFQSTMSVGSNNIIYATDEIMTQNCDTIKNHCILLNLFFERIDLMTSNKKVYGFRVKNLRDDAEKLYLSLRESNLLNPYIQLLEQKKIDIFKDPFDLFMACGLEENNLYRDPYIDYFKKAASINPFIILPVCGFTKEEINSCSELNTLIKNFQKVYILFSGKFSIGAYVFKDNMN